MDNVDKQAILDLKNSRGWKILCDDLDKRIKELEEFLLNPNIKDLIWTDTFQTLNIINQKQYERAYLVGLKDRPDELLKFYM